MRCFVFIEWLSNLWEVNNEYELPQQADLIVPVAHGATDKRLTRGAEAVTEMTVALLRRYKRRPVVIYGAFDCQNAEIEERLKKTAFTAETWKLIFIGNVISTIKECWMIKAGLPVEFDPKVIIVVTDKAHSRRCRMVWRTFFPKAKIYIVAIAIGKTLDRESPMITYHKSWKILLLQAMPTPYFWYLSLRGEAYMQTKADLHQPITKIA